MEKILIIIAIILMVIILLLIFLLAPGNNKKVNNYDWLFNKPIAHRGYHLNNSTVPENSSIAYKRAIERNYNIEIDLNLTKDNKIVVFHDGTLNRMTGLNKKVHDLTLKEIKELRLLDSDEQILELKEFLKLVDGKTGILIEYKGEGKDIDEALCVESMKILKDYKGDWVMQSFQPSILKWFMKNYPLIPRGQLCHNYLKDKEASNSKIARFLFTYHFTNFIGRPHFISRRYNDICLNTKLLHLSIPLLVWTVNSKEAYDQVFKKVDNIIFEYLDLDSKGNIKNG